MRYQFSDNQTYLSSVAVKRVPGYPETNKSPDLMFAHKANGSLQPSTLVFIGEVGFSQPYTSLVETMKTYLEGLPKVGMGIVLKYDEKPAYRNPPNAAPVDPKLRDELLRVDPDEVPHVTREDPKDPYSPLFINGLRWAGKLHCFFEVWTRDLEGKAVRRGGSCCEYPVSSNRRSQNNPLICS